MRRRFIINPAAGNRFSQKFFEETRDFFLSREEPFDAVVTSGQDDMVSKTIAALCDGVGQIVAVGGDGTLNTVANTILEASSERPQSVDQVPCVAVSNTGTGSDYFRTIIKNRPNLDWKQIVLQPKVHMVDVGVATFEREGKTRSQYFVNMASCGMSAEVVGEKEKASLLLPRRARYLLPTLKQIFNFVPCTVYLTIDGKQYVEEICSIFVGKGSYAGGGMHLGGPGILDDGLLNVLVIRKMSPWAMIGKARKLYSGSIDGDKTILKVRGRQVSVSSSRPILVELDGELVGTTQVTFRLEPRALPLCMPL